MLILIHYILMLKNLSFDNEQKNMPMQLSTWSLVHKNLTYPSSFFFFLCHRGTRIIFCWWWNNCRMMQELASNNSIINLNNIGCLMDKLVSYQEINNNYLLTEQKRILCNSLLVILREIIPHSGSKTEGTSIIICPQQLTK